MHKFGCLVQETFKEMYPLVKKNLSTCKNGAEWTDIIWVWGAVARVGRYLTEVERL